MWLDPTFRFDVRAELPRLRAPVLVIQGGEDEHGSLAHLEAIARAASGPVETLVLPSCGHAPHRERPEAVLAAVTRFVEAVLCRRQVAPAPHE